MKISNSVAAMVALLISSSTARSQAPSPTKRPPFFAICRGPEQPRVIDSATGSVKILKEINPGLPSKCNGGVVIGTELYFWAEDRDNGRRIWRTSGTTDSTVPLDLDYAAIGKGAQPSLRGGKDGFFLTSTEAVWWYSTKSEKLTRTFDSKLRFAEFMENADGLLVRTRGTGYQKPTWIYELPLDGSPPVQLIESLAAMDEMRSAIKVGSKWLRCTPWGHLSHLAMTKGQWTPISPEISAKSFPAVLGDKIVFAGQEIFRRPDGKEVNRYGVELYVSDGTARGTRLLKDILEAPGDSVGSQPAGFSRCGKKVVFTIGVRGEPNRNRLWETDGTAEGTKLLSELPHNSSIKDLTPVGEGTAFTVSTLGRGKDLWWTDGTPEGTRLVMASEAASGGLQKVGNGVVFLGSAAGKEGLWWSDGSKDGTEFVVAQGRNTFSLLANEELFAILPVEQKANR